jgi:predicted nucleic acid-binding protein
VIAVDTSSLIAYLEGDEGVDVEAIDRTLERGDAVLPPVVLTELLSDPKLPPRIGGWLRALPRLEVLEGYWERAASLRAKVLARRARALLADTLIAQSCLDHRVALVTRDADFRHFARAGGLEIVPR